MQCDPGGRGHLTYAVDRAGVEWAETENELAFGQESLIYSIHWNL